MAELPTADDFFTQKAPEAPNATPSDNGQLPSADEFFAPPAPSSVSSGINAAGSIITGKGLDNPAVNEFLQKTPVGRIMSSFGTGFAAGGEGGNLGIEPGGDVEGALTKAGIFNDHAKNETNFIKSVNEAFIRPAAIVIDNEFRGAQAAVGAIGGGLMQAAHEAGTAVEGEKTTPLLEQFAEYALMHKAEMPLEINQARSVGAIGESESQYFGLKEPTPEQAIARQQASEVSEAPAPAEVVAPKDIHATAREVAPETFQKYDAINTQQDDLRGQLADLATKRDEEVGINIPHADEMQAVNTQIDNLLGKVKGVEDRLTNKQAAKLEDLRGQFDDLSEKSRAAAGADTPDMATLRNQIQQLDFAKRDIAPDVSAAYREAESRLSAGLPPETKAEVTRPVEPIEAPEVPAATRAVAQQLDNISKDVSSKLQAVGRPAEEAEASSQLIAQHYKSIADMGWAKGTPEEIYKKDAPNIIGSNKVTKQATGKIRLATDDAKNAITLFKNANASTFIHETGHAWLDEMMRYAKDADAPESLLKDRDTVNNWLGVKEGEEIARAQHEKFARGFERYLMEGTAPSKELASVFAKFKQWLTSIYQTVQKLRSPITDDIRDIFNRLLSAKPEKTVIAAERDLGDVHAAQAEHISPERAAQVSDNIRADMDKVLEAKEPEVYNELKAAESRVTGSPAETTTTPAGAGAAEPNAGAPEAVREPGQVSAGGGEIAREGGTGEPARTTTGEQRNLASNPNARLPAGESKFVDKAGNIRLDNLNSLKDINEVIRQTARENDNFMGARRGRISDGQVLDLADALGMNPEELSTRQLGRAFNAEQIIAARRLLIQSAENLRDLGTKAGEGAEADLTAYAEARARHIMVQAQVSGVTAEAGRALRAFKQLEGGQEAAAIGDFLKENTGLDLFQLQEEAKKLSTLDSAQKVSKLIQDAKKPTYKDMILEYYINALISGPITHLRYSAGNALNALWTPLVEIPTAAGIGKIRELVTGEVRADKVYLGEAGAQLHGIIQGSKNGLMAAAEAWKTGVSPALPGEEVSPMFATKTNAIPGAIGKAINVPGRAVSAIHSFFKSIRYEQNIQGLAYRNAMIEGLKEGTDAFTNRIAELGNNPSEAMMETATSEALKELYMSPAEYGSLSQKISSIANHNVATKIILPFTKIGTQIARNAFIERTPLGLLSGDIRGKAFYAEGIPEGDMQLAKMATGVALMGGTSALVLEGLMTGNGPTDPAKRAIWLMNHTPYSIQIGDITIRYKGLGHLGLIMGSAANMTESASGWDEKDGVKLAKSFMEGITNSVLDETFMRGIKDMLDAVYHSEEYGENYIRQFANNWLVPYSVGMGQVAHLVDPNQREAHTIMEAAMNKIPFASEELQPKRDRFGEKIPNGASERYTNDPVVQRMESLQMGIGKMDKKINGVQLTEQQFDDYSRLAGRFAKQRLNNYVAIPQTQSLPPEIQIKTMHTMIQGAREQARTVVMMNNPDIIKQAYQNKVSALKKP